MSTSNAAAQVTHVKLLAVYNHKTGFERYASTLSTRFHELFPFSNVEVIQARGTEGKAGFYLLLRDEKYRAEASASIQELLKEVIEEKACWKSQGPHRPN